MHNMFRNVAIIQRTTGVTGSTGNSNLPGVDARGYEGISWVFLVNGNPTTGMSFKVQEASSSGFSTAAGSLVGDLTGTSIDMTTGIADGAAFIDVYKPNDRWVRAVIVKVSTADIIDGALVFGYNFNDLPVTHSTADVIAGEYHSHPSTGTA